MAQASPLTEKSPSFRGLRDSLRRLYGLEVDFTAWQEWNRQAADPQAHRFRVAFLATIAEHLTLWAVKVGGEAKTDLADRFIPMVRNRRNGAFVEAVPESRIEAAEHEALQYLTNAGQQAFQKARSEIVVAHSLNYLTLDEWIDLCRQARQAPHRPGLHSNGRVLCTVELRRNARPDHGVYGPFEVAFNPATGFIDGAAAATAGQSSAAA